MSLYWHDRPCQYGMALEGLGRSGPQVGHPGHPAFLRPVRSVYLPDASSGLNPSASFFPGVVGFSRADWQTSCAILANKAAKDQHPDKKSSSDADAVSGGDVNENHPLTSTSAAVNGHNPDTSASTTLDLVPMANLPRPLTIADLSPTPVHGSQLRVAYQGIRGAYSEAAADKAYPNCEAIPCDQFEVAFQAVELWIADSAVLPVENYLGGSIHRNYDLLLRHRLNIVDQQPPQHRLHRLCRGRGAVRPPDPGGWDPGRLEQRDPFRDAQAR